MNIFATYNSSKKSAIALYDKRVAKMVLESIQILSTANHCYGRENLVSIANLKNKMKKKCII